MFSLFGLGTNNKTSSSLTTKGRKMARSTQYVIYTREFRMKLSTLDPVKTYAVNVLGTASKSSALGMKANLISLLKKSGRKVINYSA